MTAIPKHKQKLPLQLLQLLASPNYTYEHVAWSCQAQHCAMTHASILHVAVRVVDKLPVELLRLLRVELLAALRALESAVHLDANVRSAAITRLSRIADFQGLRHRSNEECKRSLGKRVGLPPKRAQQHNWRAQNL